MRLSAGDRGEVIRMEDVVFTLNNIVDDIAKMYAGTSDNSSLDDLPMEVVATQLSLVQNESKEEVNLFTRPDSPTLSEPPLSAKSTGNSDSEDCTSLYSASGGPSPTSSGFTTPSSSPTLLTFLNDKDTMNSDRDLSLVPGDIQPGTHVTLECSPEPDTERTSVTETSPSDAAPISILEIPSIKLEPNSNLEPLLWAPSLSFDSNPLTSLGSWLSSEQGGIEIIYQTSASSSVFLATSSNHMPGVNPPHLTKVPPRLPPRPRPRDSPPHLPALRSPTLQFTPKLDQNEDWDTGSQKEQTELGAAHLMRQRQWARMTITHASSLAEPQSLPPCRPVDKYLEWGSYSSPSASPPRKRNLGAMGRRVHVGPRMLPRGDWDPDRRGGAIDRWNSREALRRDRIRTYEDGEQDPRPKVKPIVPLRINTSRVYKKGSDSECDSDIHQKAEGEDDAPVSSSSGTSSAQDNETAQQVHITTEDDQDTIRLCVKDGKRVRSGPTISPNSGLQSKSESPGSTATSSASGPPVDDPNAMRWCVKNGVRVSSQARALDPNPESEAGSGVGAPKSTEGVSVVSGSPQTTAPIDQKRPCIECSYAPKKRSPLSRTLLPVSPATMRFQLRAPGDVVTVGRARRKFASMMF
ncbi:unnamed protein product [Rhizoctonia solani]|uniref:Uncharacterized protein n=1 Tax=Rhizoctonia solani TaxID=456999 RepID=A0A8H3DFK1_9AGAM|nr:unnamed protein product [Rhizoctonia solani]